MNYRTLGRTGINVSEIGFGGAPAGLRNYLAKWEPGEEQEKEQIIQSIRFAAGKGINYYDTAPGYGDGASESMFGEALKPVRNDVLIATKTFGDTAQDVLKSLEVSLNRLQTDRVDLLQYHGDWYTDEKVDQILSPGGALAGLIEAKKQGLARLIGFTTEGANGPASRLLGSAEFDVMQICYNLIYQHPYDPSRKAGMIYDAQKLGVGVITMRPLTSGIFQKWLRMIDPGADTRVDIQRALLSFVLSNPLVDVALIGMRTTEEVEKNIIASGDHSLRVNLEELHERYV